MSAPGPRPTVVRITGSFDRARADELREALSRSWTGEPGTVLVDFSLAREVSDVGLAALIEPLRGGDLRLRLRGLSDRQRRLLRLLAPTANDFAAGARSSG